MASHISNMHEEGNSGQHATEMFDISGKKRRRRSAADRRAQLKRSNARTLTKLVSGLMSIQEHRGNSLSQLGGAILDLLQQPQQQRRQRQPLCRHYLAGRCHYGAQCRFSHEPQNDEHYDTHNERRSEQHDNSHNANHEAQCDNHYDAPPYLDEQHNEQHNSYFNVHYPGEQHNEQHDNSYNAYHEAQHDNYHDVPHHNEQHNEQHNDPYDGDYYEERCDDSSDEVHDDHHAVHYPSQDVRPGVGHSTQTTKDNCNDKQHNEQHDDRPEYYYSDYHTSQLVMPSQESARTQYEQNARPGVGHSTQTTGDNHYDELHHNEQHHEQHDSYLEAHYHNEQHYHHEQQDDHYDVHHEAGHAQQDVQLQRSGEVDDIGEIVEILRTLHGEEHQATLEALPLHLLSEVQERLLAMAQSVAVSEQREAPPAEERLALLESRDRELDEQIRATTHKVMKLVNHNKKLAKQLVGHQALKEYMSYYNH